MIKQKIKNRLSSARRRLFGNKRTIKIGDHTLTLDLDWKHERDYLRWATEGYLNGPLAFDTMAIAQLTHKGDRVLDAGANIGFTALLFLRAGASFIYAFEPDPRNYQRLRKLEGESIRISALALGGSDTELDLRLSDAHNQGSTLDNRIVARFPACFTTQRTVKVAVRKLDTICSDATFDFLKIDVEGAEVELIRGALHHFESNRPRIVLIESYPEIFPELHEILSPFYEYHARLLCPVNSAYLKYVPSLANVEEYKADHYVGPPTYVYSTMPLPTAA